MNARRALAALAVIAAAGCGGGPTKGELGKALFSYDKGVFGCLVVCPSATEPMAANSQVIIHVINAEELAPVLTVSSADASIATFTHLGTSEVNGKTWVNVSAVSMAAGDTRLSLVDAAGGGEVDRLPLHIRDVKKIEINDRANEFQTALTIMTGGSASLRMILRDGSNQELVGHGGLNYTYQGAASEPALLQVLFGDLITSLLVGTVPEYMEVATSGRGTGTITASSAAGASLDIPVRVIDGDEVTSVTVDGEESVAAAGEPYFVSAQAMAGAEKVHSPECFWTLSEVVGPVTISSAGRNSATLESSTPGSATVTCTIGSQSSSKVVAFK